MRDGEHLDLMNIASCLCRDIPIDAETASGTEEVVVSEDDEPSNASWSSGWPDFDSEDRRRVKKKEKRRK
jgi:hypothetical protein